MTLSPAEEKRAKFCTDDVCQGCVGTGFAIDNKRTSLLLASLRKQSGVSLVEMSRRMRLTPANLCSMEQGRRGWTSAQIEKYVTICSPEQTD